MFIKTWRASNELHFQTMVGLPELKYQKVAFLFLFIIVKDNKILFYFTAMIIPQNKHFRSAFHTTGSINIFTIFIFATLHNILSY